MDFKASSCFAKYGFIDAACLMQRSASGVAQNEPAGDELLKSGGIKIQTPCGRTDGAGGERASPCGQCG